MKQPLEALMVLFYVAMALALLTTLTGSPGWGFLFLVFGSCALVVSITLETLQRQHSGPSQSPPPPGNR
jgi:flagellar biosynthesis component FlhA